MAIRRRAEGAVSNAGSEAGERETPVDGPDAATTSQDEASGRRQLHRTAVRSFVWAAISFLSDKTLVFIATLVLARLLTPGDFGIVAAGLTIIRYLEFTVDVGVGSAVIYEQEEGITPRVQTAFTLNIAVSLVLTLLGIAFAPLVASFFNVPGETTLFRVLFLFVLLTGLCQVHDALLCRDLDFRRRMVVEVSRAAVRGGVSIALAVAGYGAWSIAIGLLAGTAVRAILNWSLVPLRPNFTVERDAVRTMLRFGVAIVVVRIATEVITNADYLVVGSQLGTVSLGYYTMAYRLPELVIADVYLIFLNVTFPLFAKLRTAGRDVLNDGVLRVLRLTSLFGFTAGVGLALVSRDAIEVLFSNRWAPAVAPMELICLAMGIDAIGAATAQVFAAVGRPGILVKLNGAFAPLILAGYVVAAPHGLAAVAAVHLAAAAGYAAVHLTLAARTTEIPLRRAFGAMRAALCGVAGILAFALPARLLLAPGIVALTGTVVAGIVGAAAGVMLGARSSIPELIDTIRTRRQVLEEDASIAPAAAE